MQTIFWLGVFVLGIYVLMKSANMVVHGAVQVMHHWRVSSTAFGIMFLASLTALPESFVSVIAALRGGDSLSYGNILGSNTANIPLVLGLSIFLGRGISIHNIVWTRRNALFLTFATVIGCLTLYDLKLDRIDGLLLLAVFALYLYVVFIAEWEHATVKKEVKSESWLWRRMSHHVALVKKKRRHNLFLRIKHSSLTILFLGTAGLLLASNFLVMSAEQIIIVTGIPQLFIGLIALGLGTTLPEVAASIAAVKNGQPALGLSNVIGDNVATILLALGLTGLIRPIAIEPVSLIVDVPLLIVITVLFTIILFLRARISRLMGFCFLILYGMVLALYWLYHF